MLDEVVVVGGEWSVVHHRLFPSSLLPTCQTPVFPMDQSHRAGIILYSPVSWRPLEHSLVTVPFTLSRWDDSPAGWLCIARPASLLPGAELDSTSLRRSMQAPRGTCMGGKLCKLVRPCLAHGSPGHRAVQRSKVLEHKASVRAVASEVLPPSCPSH